MDWGGRWLCRGFGTVVEPADVAAQLLGGPLVVESDEALVGFLLRV